MRTAKKIGKLLLDIIEVYIPVIAFVVMFISFVLQVFFRYVVRSPLTWTYELCTISFLWAGLLGALNALRHDEHVVFGLVYDALGKKGKAISDIIGGVLCIAVLLMLISPTCKYLAQQSSRYPSVIKIPFSVIFAPFLIMILGSIGRFAARIYQAIQCLRHPEAERR